MWNRSNILLPCKHFISSSSFSAERERERERKKKKDRQRGRKKERERQEGKYVNLPELWEFQKLISFNFLGSSMILFYIRRGSTKCNLICVVSFLSFSLLQSQFQISGSPQENHNDLYLN